MQVKLRDIASVIRSKNAGPFELTLDVLLKDDEMFRRIKDANAINSEMIAELYHTTVDQVISVVYYANARAIKATIVRPFPSGALQERDVYGAQQHAPIMNAVIDLP